MSRQDWEIYDRIKGSRSVSDEAGVCKNGALSGPWVRFVWVIGLSDQAFSIPANVSNCHPGHKSKALSN